MEPEASKPEPEKEHDVFVRIEPPANPVEQRRVCEACYFRGQVDGLRSAVYMLLAAIVLVAVLKHVAE